MRHHALDLIRGLAALGVVVYHWLSFGHHVEILSLGTFSVYLFFILSATTMAMVYEPRFGDQLRREDLLAFVRSRFARIVPLLALVGLISGLLWGFWERTILTATGLFLLTPAGSVSTVVGAWSLGIELLFYALLPGILLLRLSAKSLAVATLVLIAAQMTYLGAIRDQTPHWNYYVSPLTFAPYFAMGLLIYRLGGLRRPSMLLPTLLGLAVIATFSLVIPADLYRDRLPHLLLMVLTGLTVFSAYRTKLVAPLVMPATFLGDISYTLYLTHPFVRLVSEGLGFLVTFLLSILVAYLVHRLFERPLRTMLRTSIERRSAIDSDPPARSI